MKPHFLRYAPIFALLLSAGCAHSTGEPERIAKTYFTSDLKGGRLSPEGFVSTMRPLIEWDSEHAWDHAFIVKGARVYNSRMTGENEASVEVRYHVNGILTNYGVLRFDFYEIVDFTLVRKDGQWKIKKPVIPPHLWPRTAVRHLEGMLKDEKDYTVVMEINGDLEYLRTIDD